jgi:large conductance mechanosensitive channel
LGCPGRSGRRKLGSPGPTAQQGGTWPMDGFKKFLLRGNLVELAVAVVIGIAFSAIITALVADLITPLIAAIGGKPDFSGLTFTVNHSVFRYGAFINALLSFLIIAAVVYFFVVVPVARLLAMKEKQQAATERECPECLSHIPLAARRCMYCTAVVAPTQGEPGA